MQHINVTELTVTQVIDDSADDISLDLVNTWNVHEGSNEWYAIVQGFKSTDDCLLDLFSIIRHNLTPRNNHSDKSKCAIFICRVLYASNSLRFRCLFEQSFRVF